MYSFRRTEGWYDGRPVAAGSTPSKLIWAKSRVSTNTSITRTGLLSSMKSSRHSGNSVHCPRSASSTKRLINSPRRITGESYQQHRVFTHGVIPGSEPYSGSGNQLSRTRRGLPQGLAMTERGNGALCRIRRVAETDFDLHRRSDRKGRARRGGCV